MLAAPGPAVVTAPGFLITGSGRCGTGYTAEVLRGCGLNVAHEGWWTLDRQPVPGLDGDVSWLGCFDDGYSGPVYAQVRNPAEAVPSIYAREHAHPYHLVRRVTVPLTGDWAVDAALIWLHYTEHALARCQAWWRVEDIDGDLLAMHFGVDRALAARVVETTPVDINTAGQRHEYRWPGHAVTERVVALSADLGYVFHPDVL